MKFMMEKADHVKAEKRLKDSVTAKPFNLNIIKNQAAVARDENGLPTENKQEMKPPIKKNAKDSNNNSQ